MRYIKAPLAGLGSESVISTHASMFNGLKQECFNPAMIHILDRIFTGGYYELLSREQEAFFREFVILAGKVTDGILRNETLPRIKLPHNFFQFDRFLGSYKG